MVLQLKKKSGKRLIGFLIKMQNHNFKSTYHSNSHYARGSNQTKVRDYNELLVLMLIRQNGLMAKATIAQFTGLLAQTVSVITRTRETDKLLQKEAPVRGKISQPSVPMSLNKQGGFYRVENRATQPNFKKRSYNWQFSWAD